MNERSALYNPAYSISCIVRYLNEFLFLGMFQEMKVNWATSPGNQPKQDTSSKCRAIYTFTLIRNSKH